MDVIKRWGKQDALEPDELHALQAMFDALKMELEIRADGELQMLAYDLMTAFERHYPDCAKAADAVRREYGSRG